MAKGRSSGTFRDLHTLLHLGTVGNLTDRQLLERYASQDGDAAELAFAALMDRHGPMVYRVCRASLRDEHEVEDAFQAVFLVLVQKARSLWVRDSIGPWLHTVALRIASGMRATGQRRRWHERRAAEARPLDHAPGDRTDAEATLHEEIGRLPERFRAAVVTCDLEGLSTDQAAARLGWPVGTVRSRLARGRQRLRARLARRGLAPAVGVPIGGHVPMHVPVPLRESTIQWATRVLAGASTAGEAVPRAVVLSRGALKAMAWTKFGFAAAALVAGVSVAGTAMLVPRGEGQEVTQSAGPKVSRLPEQKQGDAPTTPRPQAEGVRPLAEARMSIARRGVEWAWTTLTSPPPPGRFPQAHAAMAVDDLIAWSIRWMEAEQDMDPSEAVQVAAVQGHIERLEEYLPGVREMSRDGGSGVSSREVDLVEYALLDAKTRLLKERGR